MVYADHLRSEGYDYMANQLNYKPERGKGRTPLLDGGGSFLAVHMRRRDYLYAHPRYIPSIKGAANQIKRMLEKLQIKKVFIATDAKDSGICVMLYCVMKRFSLHLINETIVIL